jgi:hypothetical protein
MLVRRLPVDLREGLDPRVEVIAERLEPFVRNERFRREIARNPEAAVTFGLGHLYLTRAGYPDATWDAIVVNPLQAGYSETKDRPPHRILDRQWAAELAGMDGNAYRLVSALSLSLLCSRAHPIHMSQEDGYAYTHCLMYATDFGRRELPRLVESNVVSEVLDAALAWTLVEPDFDLLAELLLTRTFVTPAWTPAATVAWLTTCRVWDQLGFVPGPTFADAEFGRLEGDARRAYAFKEVYHPNIVAGALCAALLESRASEIPDGSAGLAPGSLEPTFRRLRRLRGVGPDQTVPWELAPVQGEHRVPSSRVLIEAAVIHSLRAFDLEEAVDALAELQGTVSGESRTLTEAWAQLRHCARVGEMEPGLRERVRVRAAGAGVPFD